MIFTPDQRRTLQRRTAAELRQKFLRETESFLASELRLRGIRWPARRLNAAVADKAKRLILHAAG